MKNRIFAIMNIRKKRIGAALFSVCFFLTLGAGTVFASPANKEETIRNPEDIAIGSFEIKTEEEVEREIQKAFSEVFSNEFHEKDFPGMIITYDEDGVPIVTDPNNVLRTKSVSAVTRYNKNGFYSSSNCSDSNLVFYILKGKTVEVIDSSYTTTVAKVKYAGSTGYMKKSQLKF